MSSWSRVRGAIAALWFVYFVTSVLAMVPAVVGVQTIGSLMSRANGDPSAIAELLMREPQVLVGTILVVLAIFGVTCIVAPFVTMTWLAALTQRRPLSDAIATGAQRYLSALSVLLWLLIPGALVLVVLVGPPFALHLWLSDPVRARMHDITVALAALPGLILIPVWLTWHDLARSALLVTGFGGFRSVLIGARALFEDRAVLAYLGWWLIGAFALILGEVIGGAIHRGMPASWGWIAVLIATQTFVIAHLVVRARWLAGAISRVVAVSPRPPPPQPSMRPTPYAGPSDFPASDELTMKESP